MDSSVQEAIQDLITQLVRTLGPNHAKLLGLLRTFPPGADTLALRVLNIFTENGRTPPQLLALVKTLFAERDLDARFLLPVVGELDKADIVRHLPRIVGLLNGTPERKQLVRNVFGSIVSHQQPGFASSNAPRARQSELLTPSELMVLLHLSEKDIILKSAMEGTSIRRRAGRVAR
jgi:symplekin